MSRKQLIYMICTAMLIAAGTALKVLLTFDFYLGSILISRIGFHLLFVYISAIYFGPYYGMACGGLIDILSFIIAPKGPFNPIVTATLTLAGLLICFLYKKLFSRIPQYYIKTMLTVIIIQTFIVLPLVTFGIAVYSTSGISAYMTLLIPRLTGLIFYIPVFSAVLIALLPVINRIAKRMQILE